MTVSLVRLTSQSPARRVRGALLGLALAGAGAAFASAPAQAGHRDGPWGHAYGHGYGYGRGPVYGFGRHAPVHRPVYGYGHCYVKKAWRGFHRVRRVVCT